MAKNHSHPAGWQRFLGGTLQATHHRMTIKNAKYFSVCFLVPAMLIFC